MTVQTRNLLFWLLFAGVLIGSLVLLRGVMLPFVAGMAVAYFCDPLADRLERMGLSRTVATSIITLGFVVGAGLLLLLVVPLIVDQIVHLVTRLPDYYDSLVTWAKPTLRKLTARLDLAQQKRLGEAAGSVAQDAVGLLGGLAGQVWSGGMAVVGLLSLIFVTPVVTFYLLRDWDRMVALVDGWLPRQNAPTVRALMREIDQTLAGFVRGQATVCLILGTYYAVGLTLVGLDVGLIVGFVAGLISFIPYLGTIIGFVVSMGLAIAQFGEWLPIALTAAVFGIGQIIEGNVLTPKLVGEKVGLHPVWVMFALLSGGTLFGFVGVLLAVPVAATIGVLARFAMDQYLQASLYTGEAMPAGTAVEAAEVRVENADASPPDSGPVRTRVGTQ